MKLLIKYLLLFSACIVVEGAVTFTDVAGNLEDFFRGGAGECPEGGIRTILGGGAPNCQAFTSISATLDGSDQDVLGAARNLLLGLVDIEPRFHHLEKIHDEFIDETHDRYVFTDTTDQDQYGCTRQLILSVVANGANSGLFDFVPPGAVVGKRSDPTCIQFRVTMVVELREKYETAGSDEKKVVPQSDPAVAASTFPPGSEHVESNSSSSGPSIIAVAIACLLAGIVVPFFVFYFVQMQKRRMRRPREIDYPPTMLTEWFNGMHDVNGEERSAYIL